MVFIPGGGVFTGRPGDLILCCDDQYLWVLIMEITSCDPLVWRLYISEN
jgi:hypothetical protein